MGGCLRRTSGLTTERRGETLRVSLVTGDYFRVLGIGLRAGRGLTGEDDRETAPAVAVIGDGTGPGGSKVRPT